MGLKDLLTNPPQNFKYYVGGQGYTGNGSTPNMLNLRYGNDTLGGGNSNQPYIQTSIPTGFSGLQNSTNDFILRGGMLAVKDSVTDVRRLGKMFTDTKSPNGLLFIAKQNLLSRLAVRTQAATGPLNEGTYTPLSTLAQAGLVAFGGHILKNGLKNSVNPFGGTGAYSTNENLYAVRIENQKLNNIEGRLQLLLKGSILDRPIPSSDGFTTYNNGINVLSYSGGPGSILGVGKTNIRFATKTLLNPTNRYFNSNTLVNSVVDNDRDSNINKENGRGNPNPKVAYTPSSFDFRAELRKDLTSSTIMSDAPSYILGRGKTIENRVNLGNPGNRANKNLISYTNGSGTGPVDKITSLPIYRSENVSNKHIVNDLVKFRIAAIDNNDPTQKTFIHFRAFLDNMSDAYNATWSPFTYLGRGENFYTYSNFTRTINLGWTVAAQSKEELIPMYKKLNYLASLVTPDYTPKGYMAGNLVQLTVGGYLYEQVGFITSLTYDVPAESPAEYLLRGSVFVYGHLKPRGRNIGVLTKHVYYPGYLLRL